MFLHCCQDIIWAPWRESYIKRTPSEGCFLCKALKAKRGEDNSNYLLYRGEESFVIMNLFPYNNGHLMVVPNRHTGDIERLSVKEGKELFSLIKDSAAILKKTLNPDGFNIGINIGETAGAGLKEHLHVHIVPRWNGDTNFMPVISNTKVISQSMEELYKTLLSDFQKNLKCT